MSNGDGGRKFDGDKIDLSLIPLSAMLEEARGFMLGEQKYGRYNYALGMEASRLVAAALRHILAWNQGENLDPESGASHLGHARCCLAMILECERLGTLIDNRYVSETAIQEEPKNVTHYVPNETRLPDGSEITWYVPSTSDPSTRPAHEWARKG